MPTSIRKVHIRKKAVTPELIGGNFGYIDFTIDKDKLVGCLILIISYIDEMKYSRSTTIRLDIDEENFKKIQQVKEKKGYIS